MPLMESSTVREPGNSRAVSRSLTKLRQQKLIEIESAGAVLFSWRHGRFAAWRGTAMITRSSRSLTIEALGSGGTGV